jgi:hypothetical protein
MKLRIVSVGVFAFVLSMLSMAPFTFGAFTFLDDLNGGGTGGCVSCTGIPANKLTTPTGDLVKVAMPTTQNGTLEDSAMLLGTPARGNGMTDYLMMIMNKQTMVGAPINVVLVGHGGPGAIQIGDTNLDGTTKAAFVAGAKGKVAMLTLFGCCVASGTGPDFLQMLANDLMAPVKAYAGKIGVAKDVSGVMDGFYVDGGNGALRTFTPVPEPATLILLISASSMLLALRRRR